MNKREEHYLGNPLLKKANQDLEFTKDQVLEIQKCMGDPQYFVENYIKIVSLDKGLVPFKMYNFQKDMLGTFHKNRFTICKLPRQSGKSTIMVSYLLHYALFNENKNIAILANKASTARDLLGRLQLAYENLPKWLQQGVLSWNKGSLELENGSKILAASTSASAVRGSSFNIIFLDEFAFVPATVAEQFFSSVYPTISSGQSTKVIIVSTPMGMNMFYKLWNDAIHKRNTYVPIEVHWTEVPGRDEAWRKETIANTSEAQFASEFECEFLGSANTLVNASKLRNLSYKDAIESSGGLKIYERPIKDHTYFITADVARGTKNDASAFICFDVTTVPYKIVAVFKDNEIKPLLFPNKIDKVARAYNHAFVLTEVNDIGQQVADTLHFELEYDNIVMCYMRGRAGQIMGGGFSGTKGQLGVRTTKAVKKIGCSNMKQVIENDKIIVEDFDIINELSTFIIKGNQFEAEQGANDDLVMCIVLMCWAMDQKYFKELTNVNIRANMLKENQTQMENEMAPFGFVDDGINDPEYDEYGSTWKPVKVRDYETDW
jgi:hypothetical protein